MKVFRWILSHLLLLVLVWTAVYIYLDWDNFREQLPVAATEWIDNLSSRGVTVAQEPVASSGVEMAAVPAYQPEEVAKPDHAAPMVEPEVVPEHVTMAEPESAPAVAAVIEAEQPVVPQSESELSEQMPQPASGASSSEAHELQTSEKDLLVQAREAFWRRDQATAEELYVKLTEAQPNNPDLWGELGNLYFSQNKIEQAADAYYKAAEILIEEGQFRQVNNLMGIIGNVDQEKAQQLFEKMQSLHQQQPMYMR